MDLYKINEVIIIKHQTCCFTGHRQLPDGEFLPFAARLLDTITTLAADGVVCFKNGGALGFDQLAALAVLKAREDNPAIRLEMVLPHRNQAAKWDDINKKTYNRILNEADAVVYVSEMYYHGCMQKRNRCLVDGSDFCICYLTKIHGGTAYTVGYAQKKGLKIINLT